MKNADIQALAAFAKDKYTYLEVSKQGHLVSKSKGWLGRLWMWICVKFSCSNARLDKVAKYLLSEIKKDLKTELSSIQGFDKLIGKIKTYNARHSHCLTKELHSIHQRLIIPKTSVITPKKGDDKKKVEKPPEAKKVDSPDVLEFRALRSEPKAVKKQWIDFFRLRNIEKKPEFFTHILQEMRAEEIETLSPVIKGGFFFHADNYKQHSPVDIRMEWLYEDLGAKEKSDKMSALMKAMLVNDKPNTPMLCRFICFFAQKKQEERHKWFGILAKQLEDGGKMGDYLKPLYGYITIKDEEHPIYDFASFYLKSIAENKTALETFSKKGKPLMQKAFKLLLQADSLSTSQAEAITTLLG